MSRKITLIGAGSVVFAKTLVGDILQREALSDTHICLMDIDPQRLKVAEVLMNRVVQKLGVSARVSATLNQREAVRNARYVICTVQVGGYKPSTLRDFEIPAKYGLKQTIADTLGIGGIFRGLRTIPVMVALARDIADCAHPDCLLLNYTNPMAMNCWAIEEATGIAHVGLCHSVFGTARMLASHVGLPYEDINYLVAGINHMAFFLKFDYRGSDAYPLLFRVLEDPARTFEQVRYEMLRRTGYFVTESSEHQSEYVPYFIHHGERYINEFNIPINEYIRRCEAINDTWHTTEADLLGSARNIEVRPPSYEYGAYIIHARETNQPQTVYGNVPNRGLIENLPEDCCVEVPCLVDASGLHPVKIGKLPEQLAGLCQTNINVQRLTVTAALSAKREHIYHAAMLDPHTAATLPLDKIWALCDELIEAHQQDGYLGDFAPVIRNTGRSYAGVGDRVVARLYAESYDLCTAGSEAVLRLEVQNPRSEPQSLRFSLRDVQKAFNMDNKIEEVSLRVPAGQTLSHSFRLTLIKAVAQPLQIDLACDDPQVLAVGLRLRPRNLLAGKAGGAPFAFDLSGFPAVSGRVQNRDGKIMLSVTVNDSDIKPNPADLRNSSHCLFCFAPDEHTPAQAFLASPDGAGGVQIAGADGKARNGVTVLSHARGKLSYTIDLWVTPEHIGLKSSADFLFECAAKINALGDAHSGGRCSLSGYFETLQNTVHYSQVRLH